MNQKALKKSAVLAAVMILILLIVLSTATYAWFTFTPYVYVTEMIGRISDTGIELLISNNEAGPFDVTTNLILTNNTEVLSPITTNNLKDFFIASAQDSNGIVQSYSEVKTDVDKYILHGTVYLTSIDSPCDIYFDPAFLNFGEDIQALASMRIGFIFGGSDGGSYIFKLDELVDLSDAKERVTITTDGKVYSKDGLVDDPALAFAPYNGSNSEAGVIAGQKPLAHIDADEVIPVEFFLWLEGCDINCFNAAQGKDLALQFGFMGV